jgi:hypothetical protein
MDMESKTRVKALMLLAVQLLQECHDELKDFTDYSKELKLRSKQLETELKKKFIKQVDLVYQEDDGILANQIISDIEVYVDNLLESIKCK